MTVPPSTDPALVPGTQALAPPPHMQDSARKDASPQPPQPTTEPLESRKPEAHETLRRQAAHVSRNTGQSLSIG